MSQCETADERAPRVGCGCRECYRAREAALDQRLLGLASNRSRLHVRPSQGILHLALTAYLSGRMDYGALHLSIIEGLMELADKQFEQTVELTYRQPMPFVSLKSADPGK